MTFWERVHCPWHRQETIALPSTCLPNTETSVDIQALTWLLDSYWPLNTAKESTWKVHERAGHFVLKVTIIIRLPDQKPSNCVSVGLSVKVFQRWSNTPIANNRLHSESIAQQATKKHSLLLQLMEKRKRCFDNSKSRDGVTGILAKDASKVILQVRVCMYFGQLTTRRQNLDKACKYLKKKYRPK